MTQIKANDLVMLKSGGPKMFVHHVISTDEVRCMWLDSESKVQVACFNPLTLVPYVETEKP
jgi:uncharacterized protein YodC (DUF2158 family)